MKVKTDYTVHQTLRVAFEFGDRTPSAKEILSRFEMSGTMAERIVREMRRLRGEGRRRAPHCHSEARTKGAQQSCAPEWPVVGSGPISGRL